MNVCEECECTEGVVYSAERTYLNLHTHNYMDTYTLLHHEYCLTHLHTRHFHSHCCRHNLGKCSSH